ncbi:putative chitinase [Rhodoblastus acidophilus]|uniref:glycoside hydrolase family 19 protein n=1 Tax=Rhodoblastus acidophilus TaxID=1074 RepID=UPI002224564B|nr:glycoside hydrolase family 19 protein [Rhodoblastus acidophilus]MCW2318303.1 putative chitinase [Rhodoblastus acidophilus]
MADLSKVLLAIEPHAKPAIVSGFVAASLDCINRADLSTPLRQAHFLAQCAHESDGFRTTVEYASGKAYEGRGVLGNTHAGDGARYKGRGLIQLTGRDNYRAFGAALGLPLEADPELAAKFPAAALVAAEYWRARRINEYADHDSVEGCTRKVNGGLNGLASRKAYLARAKRALADVKGALIDRAHEEAGKAAAKTKAATTIATSGAATAGAAPFADGSSTWVVVAAGVSLALIAVGLFFAIRRHGATVAALTTAAQEA